MQKNFYITTPIYYPSGNPHIGHCYTSVACDTVARYKRMEGYNVLYLTGTDEHGQKIEDNAKKAGVTPKAYVDEIVEKFKKLWAYMGVDYDRYIRTTDDYHIEAVQKIFRTLYDKGYIYKGFYNGKYCKPCESFWTDSQLKEGKCPDCGREVTDAKEEAYFLKMSPFADRIEKLLTETDFLTPKNRATELVNNFIKPGLEDLCVSRSSFTWGVPIDFDPKHVVYVWIDALSNYITALGYDNDKYNDFDDFWPADLHVVAKDIMRFHAIIWPAILMALDLPLPKKLVAHGWILMEGEKMSKSKGNVVDPFILGERYTPDAIRYHILREMPLGSDSSFSNEIMITRINADLANDLGNLVSRTVTMVEKYFDSTLPSESVSGEFDKELIEAATSLTDIVDKYIDEMELSKALTEIFRVISLANKYIDDTAPWVLAKDVNNMPRLARVLYNLLEVIRITSTLLFPFMPSTSPKIWEQIGADTTTATYDNSRKYGILSSTVTVKKGAILFPRIDVKKEIEELNAISEANKAAALKSSAETSTVAPCTAAPCTAAPKKPAVNDDGIFTTATIEDFAKIKLNVGEIVSAEKVTKSKKLLKLLINDGSGERQIVSGIAKWYTPESLLHKKIVFIKNLAPATLCGEISNGMILACDANDDDVRVLFVDSDIPNGSVVR